MALSWQRVVEKKPADVSAATAAGAGSRQLPQRSSRGRRWERGWQDNTQRRSEEFVREGESALVRLEAAAAASASAAARKLKKAPRHRPHTLTSQINPAGEY